MIELVILSKQFYADYSHCPEVCQKKDRPHIQVQIELDGVIYCVPLRSNINHPHVFWTDRTNKCGLDFSKTVIVMDARRYVDRSKKPTIRSQEHNALRGREYIIKKSLIKYIALYKDAKKNTHIPRNQMLVQYSTLQYFEEYI